MAFQPFRNYNTIMPPEREKDLNGRKQKVR